MIELPEENMLLSIEESSFCVTGEEFTINKVNLFNTLSINICLNQYSYGKVLISPEGVFEIARLSYPNYNLFFIFINYFGNFIFIDKNKICDFIFPSFCLSIS